LLSYYVLMPNQPPILNRMGN